ncbi:MAG: hypothetical protein SF097_13540 [Acidobacteriota bacterium]|nr:hypothetical protein [Acidobacteriota bacterium]
MKYRIVFATIVFCLSLYSTTAQAQPQRVPQSPKLTEEQKQLQEKALAMLGELIGDAQTLRLPENRVRVFATAADLLWSHDENRARTLFADATKLLTQLMKQPDDSPEALPENVRWQVSNWRQEIVQMMARHDAQLALDFLAATRPPLNSASNAEQETQIEMMLAQQISQRDPKRALAIAKEKLASTKNYGAVASLTYNLREKDFALAQDLVDSILSKLRAEGQLDYNSALFAVSLLGHAPQPKDNGETQAKYLISAAVARELIEKALATAQTEIAKTKGQMETQERYNAINLIGNLKSSMPFIEKYAPASLPLFKRLLPETERIKDVHQKRWDDLNELASKGSPEALIQAAAKAPPEMQYSYVQRASQLARGKGDVERARQIIKENLSDSNQQRQAMREFDQQMMWQHINEGQYDEARQLMAGMRHDWERVNALMQMATSALNGEKKEIAAALLEEALAMIGTEVETSQMFSSQLQIAGAFSLLNPARSFDVLESTLDQFNELLTAAAVTESFQQQGSFRQKEMVLNTGGVASQYLPQYGQHLAGLARTDLARVQTDINRFSRPEARIAVRMYVLQQVLQSNGEIKIIRGFGGGIRSLH